MARKPTSYDPPLSADTLAIIEEMHASRDERIAMHAEAMDLCRKQDRRAGQSLFNLMVCRALIELGILIALVIMLVR